MRQRWGKAIAEISRWKKESEATGKVKVWGYEIKVPESYKAPSFVLQYIEAQNLVWVARQEVLGAKLVMTVLDELVWSVDPEKVESVSAAVLALMEMFGRAEVEWGSAWGTADKGVCSPYVNTSEGLFREF